MADGEVLVIRRNWKSSPVDFRVEGQDVVKELGVRREDQTPGPASVEPDE